MMVPRIPEGSYYYITSVQHSATDGEIARKLDRKFAAALLECMKSGGTISRPETLYPIREVLVDANRYGKGEKELVQLLLNACDKRKVVMLKGTRLHITDAAEESLRKLVAEFLSKCHR